MFTKDQQMCAICQRRAFSLCIKIVSANNFVYEQATYAVHEEAFNLYLYMFQSLLIFMLLYFKSVYEFCKVEQATQTNSHIRNHSLTAILVYLERKLQLR